jgi:hypothetical protein
LERGDAFNSRYFWIAQTQQPLLEETAKPDPQRLHEYREANLPSLKFQLFSPAPIHVRLEQAKLAGSLTFMAETLGGEHPLVRRALAGKSPPVRAAELTAGTRLGDPRERRKLAEGGLAALKASDDTMLRLALAFDAEARAVRWRHAAEVDYPQLEAYARIGEVRFKKYGTRVPPDATFTLRLAFGVVKGYREDGGDRPYCTTLGGAFDRAEDQGYRPPFVLPKRWRDNKDRLGLKTPLNFVSTADTIGGNSGSPVLNRAGELVGINFDRNRHGLVRNFVYTEEQARNIAVHSRAVLAVLSKIYDAEPLVEELLVRK